MLHDMTGYMEPETDDNAMGPIRASRAVRRRIQRFKADHGLKNADEVLRFLLDRQGADE